MSEIYAWIRNIVVFMILITIILNLLGKSDFKKYVNVVMGMLLMLVVITPIIKMLSLEDIFDFQYDKNSFQMEKSEVLGEMKQAKKSQKEHIVTQYKKGIQQNIESMLERNHLYLVDCKMELDEDTESEEFGKLKSLSVTATYVKEKEDSKEIPLVEIDQIEVGKDGETKENQETTRFETPMELKMKNIFSDFYNMSADNINVSIQGGKHEQ